MNKRIQKLAEQATTYIEPVPGHSGEGWIFDKEKFAQLIIQECIDIISPYAINIVNPGKPRMVDPGTYPGKPPNPIDEIKRNFGIK